MCIISIGGITIKLFIPNFVLFAIVSQCDMSRIVTEYITLLLGHFTKQVSIFWSILYPFKLDQTVGCETGIQVQITRTRIPRTQAYNLILAIRLIELIFL